MISVAMGLTAAVLWGIGALVVKSLSHQIEPRPLAFWFFFYHAVLVAIPAALAVGDGGFEAAALYVGVASGLATSLAIGSEARAYSLGEVVTVTPLIALEGAVAAVLGIVTGSPVSAMTALALVLCAAGGVGVGLPKGFALRSPGVGWALVAAGGFGISLWVLGDTEAEILTVLFLANLAGALVLAAIARGEVHPRHTAPGMQAKLALLGVLNLAGLLAFTYGSRNGSLPVTAVLAAQFAVPAIVGGYAIHKERMTFVQGLSTVGLLVGVGILAASAG
jgi:drug/metabolite transporter (DMT)-like permease